MNLRSAAPAILSFLLIFSSVSEAGDYRIAATLSAGAFAEDGSEFGSAIAADGEWLLIGQPLTDDGGAVHFFRKAGSNWVFFDRIVLPEVDDSTSGGRFGSAVAIQGTTAIIGAQFAGPEKIFGLGDGLAYACEFNGTSWSIVQRIAPQFSSGTDSQAFGRVVALDGEILIVCGPQGTINGRGNTGVSHVYRRVAGVWTRPADPLVEILTAGPGGAGPGFANQMGRSADLKGDYALFTASADVDNEEDAGIYAFRNIASGLPPFFDDIDGAGGIDPIRPEPALSEGPAFQRLSAVAMMHDAEALAVRAATLIGPPSSSLGLSLVPMTRSGLVWTYGDLVPLPGFTSMNFLKVRNDVPLALIGGVTDRKAVIASKGTGTWAISETLPPPPGSNDSFGAAGAIHGTTLFVSAQKSGSGGTDRGLVHVYERTPELFPVGKRAFKTTKKRLILKGTSSEVNSVLYQFGRGGFKNAKGSAGAWKIPVKLEVGKNTIKVVGKGPGGSSALLTYQIRRLERK